MGSYLSVLPEDADTRETDTSQYRECKYCKCPVPPNEELPSKCGGVLYNADNIYNHYLVKVNPDDSTINKALIIVKSTYNGINPGICDVFNPVLGVFFRNEVSKNVIMYTKLHGWSLYVLEKSVRLALKTIKYNYLIGKDVSGLKALGFTDNNCILTYKLPQSYFPNYIDEVIINNINENALNLHDFDKVNLFIKDNKVESILE